MSEAKPQIYGLLAKVLADSEPIDKDARNDQQGYNYRSLDQVVATVRLACRKHGVVPVPTVLEQSRHEYATRSGGTMHVCICTMQTTFYAPDGSSVSAVTIGEGADSGDKASNKAMSAAQKYGLLQTFLLGAEIDGDAESPEERASPASKGAPEFGKKPPAQKKAPAKAPQKAPVNDKALDFPWLDETTGFGKKDRSKTLSIDGEKVALAEVTWRQLAGGKPGGGRASWLSDTLTWCEGQDNPGKVLQMFMLRAKEILSYYDALDAKSGEMPF
jgi:hypothetical protein